MIRALVVLMFLAGAALADEAEDRKLAERHFYAGEKAYAAQNFEAAAANFEEAYKVLPLPEIAFSAAQAFRRQYRIDPKIEHAKRAVDYYRAYLDKVKTGGRVGVAADSLGEMQRELDKLTAAGMKAASLVSGERTRLGVSPVLGVEKKGASMREIADMPDDQTKYVVTIDGKQVPAFQMIDVEPGPHKVRVEATGYITKEHTERVVKGNTSVVEVALEPKPAKVTVTTEKGAHVRVDGRSVGQGPLVGIEMPAGRHLLSVARAGREGTAREIDVQRDESVKLHVPLHKTTRRRAVPFVVGAAGFLAVITLTSTILAISYDNEADDKLAAIRAGDQRPVVADEYDAATGRRRELLIGTFVTGGLMLVTGGAAAALYWLDRPSSEGVRVTPTGKGVALRGRF